VHWPIATPLSSTICRMTEPSFRELNTLSERSSEQLVDHYSTSPRNAFTEAREGDRCHMNAELDPLTADRHFLASLIDANLPALDQVLADDFILIDVMSGSEITKSSLLAVIGSGQVKFESIEPADNLVRLYQATAVVMGRTRMKGRLGGAPFAASSRYTHVFVMQQGEWRLAAAQGTRIPTSREQPMGG